MVLGTDEVLHTAKITFNNISEDLAEGDYTCNVIIGDDQGNKETKSIPFTVDLTPPVVKSPTVASYAYNSGTNEKNVWPRVGKQGVTSLEFWDNSSIVNGDGNLISFYYTNAYKKTQAFSNTYGVNLAFEDEDNSQQIPFHLYYKNSSSTLEKEDTMIGDNYKAAKIIASGTKTSVTQYYFGEGTYSFVAVDEAGNVSEQAHTVIIVKDSTAPSGQTKNGTWLKELAIRGGESNVSWSNPSGDTKWYRNTSEGENYWNFWDNGSHSSTECYSKVITLKGSNVKNATIKFVMSGHGSGIRYDGATFSKNSNDYRYEDLKPSRTNAGITQYIIGRRWADWNTHEDDSFTPSSYAMDYFDFDYTTSDSVSFQIYKDYNHDNGKVGTLYHKQGPIHFGFVDGCGNQIWGQKLDVIGAGSTWNNFFWLEY